MKSLIFGSTAARAWFPEFRAPNDIDVISKEGKEKQWKEHYWVPTFEHIVAVNKHSKYVEPQFLYTIKCAHANWNIHWQKTMSDIIFFQKRNISFIPQLYKALVKDFIKIHGEQWAKLSDKDADEFFGDAVDRKYVHDDIHEAVAYYDAPLYERILKEEGKVGCSEAKFNLLTHDEKVKLVKEEIFVTALERYLIPTDFKHSAKLAYMKSLKKLVTTMSSGWFSEWIITNYSELYFNKDYDFVEKFKQGLNKNKIRYDKQRAIR